MIVNVPMRGGCRIYEESRRCVEVLRETDRDRAKWEGGIAQDREKERERETDRRTDKKKKEEGGDRVVRRDGGRE